MKITKVNIPKDYVDNQGLDDIKMDRLGNIVLLAGKNGSGKTRVLNKVFSTLSTKPTKETLNEIPSSLARIKRNQITNKNLLDENIRLEQSSTTLDKKDEAKAFVQKFTSYLQASENDIAGLQTLQNWNLIETDFLVDNYSFIYFVPKTLTLSDSRDFSKKKISDAATALDSPGIDRLASGALAKIQYVQEIWFNATHQLAQTTVEEKEKAENDYKKLCIIIETFLGTKLTRTIDGDATLFGFPLGQSKLSDGQKILLQFCLAIYSQQQALKDLILVLDEPENHLHPAAIIEIIKRIQTCVTDGQVWIATHSIPLLAHFDPSVIWYVENGKISHAGKIPEKVLQSLLGDEEEIAKLQDFISLPAQYATTRYAYESLFAPQVVMTGKEDPQVAQIRGELWATAANGKIRVLDYGAGKGRLIANLAEEEEGEHNSLVNSIDYIAFDKYSSDKEACEAALTKVYGSAERRYYNDFDTLFSYYDIASFDVVIMCNVLHEIDPADWLTLFQHGGAISSCIKETGSLLIIEDHRMPIGEKAYQKGFLVLDTPEIKELFQIKEADTDFSFSDYRGDGRLKAHKIPKRLLGNITYKTRKAAIELLSSKARNKIIETRNADQNYKNGILHGFWTQQFANAQLNLAQLGG